MPQANAELGREDKLDRVRISILFDHLTPTVDLIVLQSVIPPIRQVYLSNFNYSGNAVRNIYIYAYVDLYE